MEWSWASFVVGGVVTLIILYLLNWAVEDFDDFPDDENL